MSVFLLLAALQLAQQSVPADEGSLVWTEYADPDPGYVPPRTAPVKSDRASGPGAEDTVQPPSEEELRQAQESAKEALSKLREAVLKACVEVQEASGDDPACSE